MPRVSSAAVGLVLLASLAGWSAAASAGRAPRLTIEHATVVAHWREGWLHGRVVVRGRVGAAAEVRAVLRRTGGGSLPRTRELRVRRAGRYVATLTLPARPLPGRYRVRVTASTAGGRLPAAVRTVTVPAPREGVVDRAVVSTTLDGARARTAPASTHTLFARFHFFVRPRAKAVAVTWRTPSYDVFTTSRHHTAGEIRARMESLGTALARGRWFCILTVDGRVAKRVAIRIK